MRSAGEPGKVMEKRELVCRPLPLWFDVELHAERLPSLLKDFLTDSSMILGCFIWVSVTVLFAVSEKAPEGRRGCFGLRV